LCFYFVFAYDSSKNDVCVCVSSNNDRRARRVIISITTRRHNNVMTNTSIPTGEKSLKEIKNTKFPRKNETEK